jgi:hypothetical protein
MAKIDLRNLDDYTDDEPKEKIRKTGKKFKEDDSKKKKK